jgi:hypothetical protein
MWPLWTNFREQWKFVRGLRQRRNKGRFKHLLNSNNLDHQSMSGPLCPLFHSWVDRKHSLSWYIERATEPDEWRKDLLRTSKIEKNKYHLEESLFKKTYEHDLSSYDYVNYDLTNSYLLTLSANYLHLAEARTSVPATGRLCWLWW